MDKKKYGLFIPKKNALGTSTEFVKKPSVFDEDSDSDKETNVDWVKKSLKKEPYGNSSLTRQAKSDIQKVLADDPTAYQYDEVYDELQKNINENLAAKKSDRKPKYIQSLMQTAERRKRENERRLARQIQKEREAEGDEFADKEVFVTSAYKKKLEEMKKMDEEDKHTEMLEDIGDVMKQRDMVGFYRHLYRATVTNEDLREPDSPTKIKPKEEPREEPTDSSKSSKPRQYRKRKSSESSDGETKKSSKSKSKTSQADNPDADSDLSSSDDEKDDTEPSKDSTQNEASKDTAQNEPAKVSDQATDDAKDKEVTEDGKKLEETDENKENVEEPKPEPKPKVSVWIKRTVGEVFDEALERYYQRKAERLAARGS